MALVLARAPEKYDANDESQTRSAIVLEDKQLARRLATLEAAASSGLTLYAYNPAVASDSSLAHKALTVGAVYQYAYFDSTEQDGSNGRLICLDQTGSGTVDGTWHYDTTLHRSYLLGAGAAGSQYRLFKSRSDREDLRSWGLNCVSGSGGDTTIASAVTDVRNSYYADTINTSLGAPLTGVGVHTPTAGIDIANANWDAPQLTLVDPGLAAYLPVLSAGRPTSGALNDKLDNPQIVRATIKGTNTSTNAGTMAASTAIGLQTYDWASPSGEIDLNASRLWCALNFGGNSEKLDARVGGGMNWQLVRYSPAQVSATYGGTTAVSRTLWPFLQNRGSWNPNTNTPALASGVGTKGYFYKCSTGGSTNLDGNSTWLTDDLAFFDGSTWQRRSTVNFSPDSNRIRMFGEQTVTALWMPDAADCSGTFDYEMESRFDPGTSYDITNLQGATIPLPHIYDGAGKETVHTGWFRSGDQRLLYYANKDNGIDTTRLGFVTDHLYGTAVRIDRALNVAFDNLLIKDQQNGRYFGNSTPIPCPVVQLGSIGTVTGEFSILQSLNREGILGGDVVLGLQNKHIVVRGVVKMGQATSTTDITSGRSYVALRVQYADDCRYELRNSQGQIVLPDLCVDGSTPTNIHRTTVVLDSQWCATGCALTQGSSVDASVEIDGGMSFSDARAAVANMTGVTGVRFHHITDRQSAMTYDGSKWRMG